MKIKRIRKLKRKKKYNPNVNRKRLRNKLRKLPDIPCNEIKKEWEYKRSTRVNLKEMGLAYDANEAMQLPNVKHELLEGARRDVAGCEDASDHEEMNVAVAKSHIAETLEAEAKAPRQRLLKLPKAQTQFLTYLIKKYGEDYEAMSRDRKNHYQLTWKQIRAKIKMFKRIPEQYNELAQNSDEQFVS